jgi:hypothetical protein
MRTALALGSLITLSMLALGCESRVSLGGRCSQITECATALTCVGELCREDCNGPEDCPAGQRCIAGPSRVRACSRPVEETCSATDPCNSNVFTECREGQCVTGCTAGTDCVSGTCDTSGAVGVCAEIVSTGGVDAGIDDDAARTPDDATRDAGDGSCLPEPSTSSRTIADAVFGGDATATTDTTAIWMETAGDSLDLADTFVELAIGVYAEGAMGPGLLAAVNLGPHEMGQLEIAIRRASPFTSGSVTDVRELNAEIAMSAFSIHSGPDFANLAVLRPNPESLGEAFAWIVREGQAPTALTMSRSTFPGRAALLEGPDVDGAREILMLDELRAGEHSLAIVGSPYGVGNADQQTLASDWGDEAFSMSPARQAVLLRQPTSRRTILARCLGAMDSRPLLTSSELTLPSDAAPALLATASSPSAYRAVTRSAACDELPLADITCSGPSCSASEATTAIDAADPIAFETTSWGAASIVAIVDAAGARIVVLDADGRRVTFGADADLDASEPLGLETVTLREAHVAASVSGDVAVLALGGLYEDSEGGGHVLVRLVRLTRS